jgi:hypothetical protein
MSGNKSINSIQQLAHCWLFHSCNADRGATLQCLCRMLASTICACRHHTRITCTTFRAQTILRAPCPYKVQVDVTGSEHLHICCMTKHASHLLMLWKSDGAKTALLNAHSAGPCHWAMLGARMLFAACGTVSSRRLTSVAPAFPEGPHQAIAAAHVYTSKT